MRFLFLTSILCIYSYAIQIIQKPIIFDSKRVQLTKEYIQKHYGLYVKDIKIIPKIIVVHHTGIDSFEESFKRFKNASLSFSRSDISKASNLNVSSQFMIDTNGTIYQLMPDNFMARHTIGLNYSSIGIENVGGENLKDNLTNEQLKANIKLIKYLMKKYPSIHYVIGHYEYQSFENTKLWLEKDKNYRTIKHDPSEAFMEKIRDSILLP